MDGNRDQESGRPRWPNQEQILARLGPDVLHSRTQHSPAQERVVSREGGGNQKGRTKEGRRPQEEGGEEKTTGL